MGLYDVRCVLIILSTREKARREWRAFREGGEWEEHHEELTQLNFTSYHIIADSHDY